MAKIGDIGQGASAISLYEYHIDLNGDLRSEEADFARAISGLTEGVDD